MPSVDPWIGPRGSAAQRLLAIIRARGPLTRPDVARLTGMSLSGIRPLVAQLVAQGELVEDVLPPATGPRRGRPPTVLSPTVPEGLVVALDFGHAHVTVALADLNGAQLELERFVVDVDHRAEAALDRACSLAGRLIRRRKRVRRDVRRVVAGVPGPIDRTGRTRSSTIVSSWWQLDIAAEIARRLRVDTGLVDVENDAHLGALGEVHRGAASGCTDVLYVKASHGLGAGLVLDGELYRGAHGLTGELGHTVVDPDGALCRCGSRGCLETVVSVAGVAARMRFVTGGDEQSRLDQALDHPAARRVVTEAGRALGRVLADLCNVLDPQRIVLGGELAATGDPLVEGVVESLRRYAQPGVSDVDVVLAELGEQAQITGATELGATRARDEAWGH